MAPQWGGMSDQTGQRSLAAAGLLLALLLGCGQAPPTSAPPPTPLPTEAAQVLLLPTPLAEGSLSLEEALAQRRSVRQFSAQPLTLAEIGQLFWAAQGVTRPWGGRTAPSAGALYPLEIYAATAEGLYHYLPASHRAELVQEEDQREALWAAGLRQEPLRQAPVIFVITAVSERTAAKYGSRAERYVKIEVGHAAQNLLLQAVSSGLGAVPIGAFDDVAVATALHLPAGEEPLYLIPVGHPEE